jgi:hypothetical protein
VAGKDITEKIPVNIGNPGTTGFWVNNAEEYDVAIGGYPFMMVPTDVTPYQRETAQYRKDQFDNGTEPGEQSLTGWWLRSQSSFHNGSGIKFFDRTSGESIPYRFADSQGVDVWTKGQVTLLHDVIQGHITTGAIRTNGRPYQLLQSIQWGTTNGALLHDGLDLDKIDSVGAKIDFVDYNTGTSEPIHAVCNDGVYAYFVSNNLIGGTPKLHFYKKPLTGDATTGSALTTSNGDCTLMFTDNGTTITNAVMEFVKDRIVLCVNNKVYEIAPNASALPTPVYTNPNTNYIYTSITASGPAIYTSGYSGIYSTIHKYKLSDNGTMPVLAQPVVAAELPAGERIFKLFYYLGKIMIGTNKGVRVASVDESVYLAGALSYGPLIVETNQPAYDFTGRDRFVWATTGVGTDSGLIRIDLSANIEGEELRFGWANDLQNTEATPRKTTAVTFAGDTNLLLFATTNDGTTDGHVYAEHATNLRATGYVKTGFIRFGTLEPKNFKFIRARGIFKYGALDIESIDEDTNSYNIISYNSVVGNPEAATTQPEGSQEYISFKFTLSRSASDSSLGPTFKGYQVKALPATERSRLIQFPVWCYDVETDRNGVATGYKDRAWERIQEFESLEKLGDIVNVQDFTTGERVQAIIEKTAFTRKSPPSGDYSGFGGILNIIVRTVS